MHATFDRNSLFPSFFIFKYKKITLFVHSFVRVFFLISIFLIEMTCRLTDVTLKMFIKQNHCCVLPVLFGIRVFSAFIATLFFGYISLLTANTVAVCFSFSLSLCLCLINVIYWNYIFFTVPQFPCIFPGHFHVVLTVIVLTFIRCRHQ